MMSYVDNVRRRNKRFIIPYAGVERSLLKNFKFPIKIFNAKMKPRPFITVICWRKLMFIFK